MHRGYGDIRQVESRFSLENLLHNLALGEMVKLWVVRKQVPIPGTTQMPHLIENIGAAAVRFTPTELVELSRSVSAIQIRGAHLPDAVLIFSGVERLLRTGPLIAKGWSSSSRAAPRPVTFARQAFAVLVKMLRGSLPADLRARAL